MPVVMRIESDQLVGWFQNRDIIVESKLNLNIPQWNKNGLIFRFELIKCSSVTLVVRNEKRDKKR